MYCYEAVHQQSRRDRGRREGGRRIQGHSKILACDFHYGRGVFDPSNPPALGLGEHRRGGGEVGRKRGGNFCNLFVWLTC